MKVILTTKVDNLGGLGDSVNVKPGYARNHLIPSGKAKAATPGNIAEFERRKAELEKSEAVLLAQVEERRQKVDGLSLTIAVKTSDEGTLFGSVGTTEIMEAVTNACGEPIQRSDVLLADGALREIGEHEISLKLHPGVVARVRLNIVAEE